MRHYARAVAGIVTLSVVASCAEAFAAPNHLVPEDSPYAGMLRSAPSSEFNHLFDRTVVARMIAEPSFVPAYGVGLKVDANRYGLLVFSAPFAQSKGHRCEKDIEPELGKRAIAAWRQVLLGMRFSDDPVFGADGVTVHFSMLEAFDFSPHQDPQRKIRLSQLLYGQIWTPDPGTPPALLLDLADSLADLCEADSPVGTARATQEATRALEALDKMR